MKQRFFLSVSAIILGVLCSARPSLAGPSAAVVLQRNSLGAIPDGPAKDDGMAAGRAAAAAMIVNRTGDGSAPAQFYTPASDAPYQWQPTPSCASAPANNRGLFFHWQFVKPFGIESSAQFRARAATGSR